MLFGKNIGVLKVPGNSVETKNFPWILNVAARAEKKVFNEADRHFSAKKLLLFKFDKINGPIGLQSELH